MEKTKEQIQKERDADPQKREEYLKKCREQSEAIFSALEKGKQESEKLPEGHPFKLSEDDYLSIASTAEYLENESVGVEGVGF